MGLAPTPQQSKAELAQAVNIAKISTASVGKFQDNLPKEKTPKNTGKRRKFQPLIGDFGSEKQKQLELLKVMDSKKPRLDITKAVNKQMREEDMESRKKNKKDFGKKGQRGKMSGKGKGKAGGKGKGPKGKGRKPQMKQGKR
uniref:Ribosome biogenesis regulator 1 homolog n=1 Tax=Cyprinus carpio TaxID=7962 RepID=A0A8C1VVM2_CYPCA